MGWLTIILLRQEDRGGRSAWKRNRGSNVVAHKRAKEAVGCNRGFTIPGGLVSGARAYQGQFRRFESHCMHTRRVFFLLRKLISGKHESVSYIATFDQTRTSSGNAEPYARQKNEGTYRRREGATHVTKACSEDR